MARSQKSRRAVSLWRSESPAWSILAVVLLLGALVGVSTLDRGDSVTGSPPPPAAPSIEPTNDPSFAPSASSVATPSSAPSTPPPPEPAAETRFGRALDLLAEIPIKGRAPKTGYERDEQFGNGWIDVDRNGCDTRNDVLARDLEGDVLDGPCTVLAGVLNDPYTGEVIPFARGQGTSSEVQIDHVVALLNAWETGAQQLTQEQRIALANDPLNLLAVGGSVNAQKGSGDAATWLPPRRVFWCGYVATQIEVKAKHELWVTNAERDAMVRVLSSC